MKQTILLLTFSLFTHFLSAQILWDGGGDGTSWNDAANWAGDMVPPADSLATFDTLTTVTGTFSPVAGIRVNGPQADVVLDLDITLDNSAHSDHIIAIGDSAALTLGVAGNNRTFDITGPDNKHTVAIFGGTENATLIIAESTTLDSDQGTTAINLASPTSTVTNNGTILATGNFKDGFRVAGTFVNNGSISGGAMKNDLFNVKDGGSLTNNAGATITAVAPGDDGIELVSDATLVNDGTLELTGAADAGSANSGLAIGKEGEAATFTNNGTVIANGGAGENARPIYVYDMGAVENNGTINVSGGNLNASFFVVGSVTIDTNATVDLSFNRISVDPLGTLVNNGFITTDRDGPGVFTSGTSTNNGFFNYATANSFSSGQGTIVDNGISVNDDEPTRINARGECGVDLTDAPYAYFLDGELLAMSGDTGLFVFPENSVMTDSVILTTTLPGVSIKVVNICAEAVDTGTGLFAAVQADRLDFFPTVVAAGGQITLELGTLSNRPVTFHLIDARGSIVSRQTVNGGGRTRFAVGNQPAGAYTLRAVVDRRLLIGRLIVGR